MVGDRDRDVPRRRSQRGQLIERDGRARLERVPAGLGRGTKRRQRRPLMPRVEQRVRVHHAQNGTHDLADVAAFRGEIVLDAARDPQAWHFLINDEAQAVRRVHAYGSGKICDNLAPCPKSRPRQELPHSCPDRAVELRDCCFTKL